MIEMKFVIFYDYNPEDIDKITEKWNEILKAEEGDYTKTYPKFLSDAYVYTGQTSGLQLCETDDPDKLTRLELFWRPYIRFEYIPLTEVGRTIDLWKENNERKGKT